MKNQFKLVTVMALVTLSPQVLALPGTVIHEIGECRSDTVQVRFVSSPEAGGLYALTYDGRTIEADRGKVVALVFPRSNESKAIYASVRSARYNFDISNHGQEIAESGTAEIKYFDHQGNVIGSESIYCQVIDRTWVP